MRISLGLSVVLLSCLLTACQDKQPEEPLIIGHVGSPNAPTYAVKNPANSGDGQTAIAGLMLSDSLAIRVVTATGFPVGNVRVQWAADSGGSISPAVTNTNNDGIAKARWTLGPQPGIQTATASANGTPNPVTFTASALAVPATLLGSARRER